MRRNALRFGITGAVALSLIVYSCGTDRYSLGRRAPDSDQYRYELTLTFLDEEELIERFSKINNPFLSPYTFLKNKNLTTFELVIENRSPGNLTLQIALSTVTLATGTNKTYYARNQFKLSQFWEGLPDDQKRGTPGKLKYVINKNVLENSTYVKSGETIRGLLVFQGNIQKWSETEVHIPLFNERDEFIVEYVEKVIF